MTDALPAPIALPAKAPRPRLWWRVLSRFLLIFIVVPYVAVGGLMVAVQRQLLFVPTKTERLPARDVSTPDRVVEDIELVAANELKLHGWHFHARKSADSPSRVVLYFPGNAGCRRDRIQDVADLTELGCDVLLMDYRGYGDNQGQSSETLFAVDARRLWMYAIHDLGHSPDQIVLFGESLGGAVAIRLAAEMSFAGTPPAALIVNSTFSSMGDTVAWHYPAYPFRYFLLDPFPSHRRIPAVTCPFLQFHGTADETVPFAHAEKLFAAAPADSHGIHKKFVTVDGAGHNMVAVSHMREEIQRLFASLDAQ